MEKLLTIHSRVVELGLFDDNPIYWKSFLTPLPYGVVEEWLQGIEEALAIEAISQHASGNQPLADQIVWVLGYDPRHELRVGMPVSWGQD
jgi:hypothetical protein